MLNFFSKNEKLFFLHSSIFAVPLSIAGVFINFFVWDKTASLVSVGLFQAYSAAGIVVGAFLGAILLNRIAPNIMRIVGSIFTAISIGIILVFSYDISKYILPSGLFFGIAIGSRAMANKLIFLRGVDVQSREKYINNEKHVSSISAIIVPFAAALLISKTGNYTILFILVAILFALSSIPLLMIKGLGNL
ncbi:hypothetical protein JW796_03990 [Candidatus Dojkabacteria bacterium]|nr:hypothetical protein [Candidatus Dojkabacteria bacterium]